MEANHQRPRHHPHRTALLTPKTKDHGYTTQKDLTLPPNVRVQYSGVVQRDDIPSILWESDCMVLPTAGENYGHVVAESLQAGCPVIITPRTPWTAVIQNGGGEVLSGVNNPQVVGELLDRWAAKTPEEMIAMRWAALEAFNAYDSRSAPNIIALAQEALIASLQRG